MLRRQFRIREIRIVIAVETYRFSAPFAFESSQTFIALRHFAEIKDLESIPARVIDSLPEDDVVGPKSKIARLGGAERVRRSSTEGEEDAAADDS